MFNISKKIFLLLLIPVCIIVNIIDIFLLHRHSHFSDSGLMSMDGINGFYSLLPLIGTVILLIIARFIYKLLSVNEDYYDADF